MRGLAFYILLIIMVLLSPGIVSAQDISITKVGEWGSGRYRDVFIDGNYAYCAAGDAGVDILNISNPAQPVKVSNCDMSGTATGVFARGNYLYTANHAGLVITDVSNPFSPILKGVSSNLYVVYGWAVDVFVIGDYAYVASMEDGLYIYDVSDPESPEWVTERRTFCFANDVDISGGYAYLSRSGGMWCNNSGIEIYDLSNLASPLLTGRFDLNSVEGIHAVGNYVYAAYRDGLKIIDVSDPYVPTEVGVYEDGRMWWLRRNVFVSGNYAYLAAEGEGIDIIDINNPACPIKVGNYDNSSGSEAYSVFFKDNYAYVAYDCGGLEVLDISNPASPSLAGSYDDAGDAGEILIKGNYAYLLDACAGLLILDVSTPRSHTILGNYSFPIGDWDFCLEDNLAYVLSDDNRFLIIDVSNPSAPSLAGSFETRAYTRWAGLHVKGDYAYVAEENDGLMVFDISTPSAPTLVAVQDVWWSLSGLEVLGDYVYLFSDGGLYIFDVSVPTSPTLATTNTSFPYTYGMSVRGNYAYVLADYRRFQIYNISDPVSPTLVGNCQFPSSRSRVWSGFRNPCVKDNYVFIAFGSGGLRVVDISSLTSPQLVAQYNNIKGSATDVEVKGNYIYITSRYWSGGGILTLLHFDSSYVPPQINVNRTSLAFASDNFGTVTSAQPIFITTGGEDPMTWSASADQNWLICTPPTGTGSGEVLVCVEPSGLPAGTYNGTLSISSPDTFNPPQTVAVTLTVHRAGHTSAPFGIFATPTHGATVSGSVPFTGWALDDIEVQNVQLFREAQGEEGLVYIGDAVPVEGARPDVEQAYPGYPMTYKSGWGYMMLTNFLPDGNGTFTIHAVAVDVEGKQATLGTKTIIVDNQNAVKPFGTIDTPVQGGTVSGGNFINWGWVLTPRPNTIPTDGSTIQVWVDGIALGNPVYNIYREDIAALFPDNNNSSGAVGYFTLDCTQWENGVHTISWTAEDDAGNSDGIGSRYFNINNAGNPRRGTYEGEQGLASTPLSFSPAPVAVTKGYNREIEPQTIYPDNEGIVTVEIRELERLVIHFLPGVEPVSPLPIGSTLDREKGIFYWQPGPGFVGDYPFVFIEKSEGETYRRNVTVRISPSF